MTRIRIAAALALLGAASAQSASASPAIVLSEPMLFAYPATAFDRKEEGRVGVELAISPAGTVEGCTVVKPVSQSLDEASCRFWKRTRFRAASDERGQPVPSVVRKFSDWRLPVQVSFAR